jgi:hypothetical protein
VRNFTSISLMHFNIWCLSSMANFRLFIFH